ncbi:MAG: hypothetical protein AAGF32_09030 [Pseudomonadota bacterium]
MPGFTIDFDSYDPDDIAADDILADPLPDDGQETLEHGAGETAIPGATASLSAA